MARFPSTLTSCPTCASTTLVITGNPLTTGYRRYRRCQVCGCKFTTLQAKGSRDEVVVHIIIKGNVTPVLLEADDEPEPGATWQGVAQMRKAMYISALNDVKWFGRVQPDTLTLAGDVRQRKGQ